MSDAIFAGKTLLVVEDEPDLREPIAMEFESYGCRVLQAGNGREAFAIVCKEQIDAVISDIRMPGGDGVELLHNIKNRDHTFPVVMLITGYSDLSREEAYHIGAEAILAKPFDLDEIVNVVKRILTDRAARWTRPAAPLATRGIIERRFAALADAIDEGKLALGRGGLFLRIEEPRVHNDSMVTLHIQFESGDLLVLEGAGVVRWARRGDESGRPPGVGIEFEWLTSEARETVLELTNRMQVKPFIPRS